MANTKSANVIGVDTTAAFADATQIIGIKIVGGSGAATLTLKSAASASGTLIYEGGAAISTYVFEPVNIRDNQGVYATISGTGAKAYLYLR